jgi:hypothetical protein
MARRTGRDKVLDDLSCDILVVKSEPLEARVAAEPCIAY